MLIERFKGSKKSVLQTVSYQETLVFDNFDYITCQNPTRALTIIGWYICALRTTGLLRAVARTLIGGGVFIHIFWFCPTDFFRNKLYFKRN